MTVTEELAGRALCCLVVSALAAVGCGPSRPPAAATGAATERPIRAQAPSPPVVPQAPACPAAPALSPEVPTAAMGSGGKCPAGACPAPSECRCDAAGRVTSLLHAYPNGQRERSLVRYDASGLRQEVYRDLDADGHDDARYVYAHNQDGTCVVEAADDDRDGVVEQVCTYDRDCLRGEVGCQPRSCAPLAPALQGAWCEAKDCPAQARCTCDLEGRVVGAYFNLDRDAAYETHQERAYLADSPLVAEQRSYARGALGSLETFVRDDLGRVLRHRFDEGGDGSVEREARWSWGTGKEQWLSREEWTNGQPTQRYTRTYRDGALLTETQSLGAGASRVLRFLPGASSDVVQPIVISSGLLAPRQVACERDADCVVVRDLNCCTCSSGGIGAVVGRRHAAALRRSARQRCGASTVCPAVISSDPTCMAAASPVCVEKLCTLRRSVSASPQ